MIRIIKEGKVKNYRHMCKNCGCEFTYNSNDISRSYNPISNTDRSWEYEDWISCPMCGTKERCEN